MRLDLEDESVVVVPSISIERTTAGSGTVMQAMEERALFLLLLLRQPRLRMIYVTSQPMSEVDHRVLPRVASRRDSQPCPRATHAWSGRRRVAGVAELEAAGAAAAAAGDPVADPEPGPQSPDPLQHHTARAGCRAVALASRCTARIPDSRTSAARPAAAGCSRNSGCGVRSGRRTSTRVDDIVAGVQGMRARRPSLSQAIVKLNEGVSGSGNAMVDLSGLPASWLAGRGGGDHGAPAAACSPSRRS